MILANVLLDFIKPRHFISALGRIFGVGILLAEGDEHKVQRKNLMPAFAFRHIKELYPSFWRKSREMVDRVAEASKSTVPPSEKLKDATADAEKDAADAPHHAAGAIEVGDCESGFINTPTAVAMLIRLSLLACHTRYYWPVGNGTRFRFPQRRKQ
jgi:hypothetical protein